jgi:hypothetical protein
LAAQGLHLHGQGQGAGQAAPPGHQAVIGHQAGAAIPQRFQDRVRQGLGAEGGVAGAADVDAAGHGHHVVEGGNVPAQAGQGHGEGGMGVDDGAGLGKGGVDVPVEAPFAGGLQAFRRPAFHVHRRHVDGGQFRHVPSGGRDQEAFE